MSERKVRPKMKRLTAEEAARVYFAYRTVCAAEKESDIGGMVELLSDQSNWEAKTSERYRDTDARTLLAAITVLDSSTWGFEANKIPQYLQTEAYRAYQHRTRNGISGDQTSDWHQGRWNLGMRIFEAFDNSDKVKQAQSYLLKIKKPVRAKKAL